MRDFKFLQWDSWGPVFPEYDATSLG